MFQRLKECKTFKEIFTIIGTKPFEKVAFGIILLWCMMPLMAIVPRVVWYFKADNDYQYNFVLRTSHQYIVEVLGYFTVYIAIFFLISRLAVYGKEVWKKVKAEPWHFFLLVMLLWACISTLRAEDIKMAYEGDDYLAEGLRLYFAYAGTYICSFIIVTQKNKNIILNVFNVVANIISMIVIVVDMTDIAFLNKIFPAQLAASFMHYNHAGYYINMGIVCAIGLYMYAEGSGIRLWYGFSIFLQVYGILMNTTLGGFIGTWCALVMVLMFYKRKNIEFNPRMLTPIGIMLAVMIASYLGYVPNSLGQDMRYNVETFRGIAHDLSEDAATATSEKAAQGGIGHGRVFLWKQSLKMIPKRPIFGYGPEHLDPELSKAMWIMRPDNEFIQHAVFLGVPALVYYLISLIWLFLHQWKYMERLDKSVLTAAGCVIAYLVAAMFGVSTFYTTPYLYMFWGMAAGRTSEVQEEIVKLLEE